MKKSTILAAAIAATISGSTFAADTSMYGNMRLEVINQDELNMDSHKLIIGYKASEDMGNGMTGFMHLELENDNANERATGLDWNKDLAYVGVKGDFGSVSLGVQNDAAGFACSGTDIFTINGGDACGVGAVNNGLDNTLLYVGAFGDVTVAVAATLDGSDDQQGDNALIGVKYDGGVFTVGGQITKTDKEIGGDNSIMVLGGTYTINDIVIGFTFADNDADNDNTAMAIAVQAPLAGGTVKVGIDTGDALDQGAAGDGTATNLEFVKNMSKSVYWGASFTSVDDDSGMWADDQIAAWLGMKF